MEHPRPDFRRRLWVDLGGEWEFGAGPSERFDRRIRVPFAPQSELSGLGLTEPGDVLWYRRRFEAPPAERLLLHFGAVDYRADVFLNGEHVAYHEGGHTPFSTDVTRTAGRLDNVLVVRVEDPLADRTIPRGKQHWTPEPEGIFYTPTSGIWQPVWLEPVPARSIRSLRIVPDLETATVDVGVDADGTADITVTFAGRLVAQRRGSGTLALGDPHPWSPESPHLYGLHVALGEDSVESYFGLRSLETGDGLFRLNGEPYVQRLVMDQGYYPGGVMTPESPALFKRDIELAKSLGFNGARKHQKVEDPRYLCWADRLGFLVWGEMPSLRAPSEDGERRLMAEWKQAVARDRDHPCIVAWVPVNEGDGMRPDPAAFLDEMHRITKELDGTRPVVSNDGWEHATTDLCTLHDYAGGAELRTRYRSLEAALDPAARTRPAYLPGYAHHGEPLIVSEFGGVALGEGGWGYSHVRDAGQLEDAHREMVEALMEPGPVEGFCYTQLYDVELERNGLLTFDRTPKADPSRIRAITQTPKRR